MRFFEKAMDGNGLPEKIVMDKSGANKSAIDQIIDNQDAAIVVRQVKYLNNIVEQDHRAIKRQARPMLGFKTFSCGQEHSCRHRAHAHDQEGTDANRRWQNHVIC